MAVHASMPPRRGIRTSISTTSGSSSAARSTASLAVAGLADDLDVRLLGRAPSPARDGTARGRRRRAPGSARRARAAGRAPLGSASIRSSRHGRLPGRRSGVRSRIGDHAPHRRGAQTIREERGRLSRGSSSSARRMHRRSRSRAAGRRRSAVPVSLVEEQEEVVPDQLHLVERLVERHRRALVGLLPDDQRAVALRRDARASRPPSGSPASSRPAPSRSPPRRGQRLALRAARRPPAGCGAVVHLRRSAARRSRSSSWAIREVERGVPVVGRGLGPDHRAARAAGQLDPLALVGQPRVALLGRPRRRSRMTLGPAARPWRACRARAGGSGRDTSV